MPVHQQPEHASSQVVSVRLDADVVRRLDALADRTRRSRATYIRLALEELLPQLEAEYWNHQAVRYETDLIDTEFIRITSNLMQDESQQTGKRRNPTHKSDFDAP